MLITSLKSRQELFFPHTWILERNSFVSCNSHSTFPKTFIIYPVDANFSAWNSCLLRCADNHECSCIVILHAGGIRDQLSANNAHDLCGVCHLGEYFPLLMKFKTLWKMEGLLILIFWATVFYLFLFFCCDWYSSSVNERLTIRNPVFLVSKLMDVFEHSMCNNLCFYVNNDVQCNIFLYWNVSFNVSLLLSNCILVVLRCSWW